MINSLFRPAIAVLDQLKYLQKFVLVAIFVLIPFAVLRFQFRNQMLSNIEFSSNERVGLMYLDPLADLLDLTLRYIALAPVAEALDDPELLAERESLPGRMGVAVAAVDAVDAQHGALLDSSEAWAAVRADLSSFIAEYATLNARQRSERADALTRGLLRLMTRVGNTSNLILDPDIDSYYYMDTVVTTIPLMATYINEVNAQVITAFSGRGLRLQDTTLLVTYEELIYTSLRNNLEGLEYAFEVNAALRDTAQPMIAAYNERVLSYLYTTSREILGRAPAFRAQLDERFDYDDPAGFYRASADTLDMLFGFRDMASAELDALLRTRIDAYNTTFTTVAAVVIIMLLLAFYLVLAFYLSVRRTIDDLATATRHMVRGDRDWGFKPRTRDELAEVAVSFNQIAGELIRARDQALESARAKSSFLANMSHELRTPLNAILGFSGILSSGMVKGGTPLEPAQIELLQRIESNGKRLRDVINDILDLAKIESGRIAVTATEARPRHFVEEGVAAMRSLAVNRGIALEVEFAPDAPEVVLTDVRKVNQILTNLLGNAIKFTHEGGVYVNVTGDGRDWVLKVRDTGIGIPLEAQRNIFETFRQVDETDRREYEGTGLGLAIVRSLAEAMQGRVGVQSEVDKGSTFTVTLPQRLEAREV
ncbi:MAG: ATP-binding protein [Anaerolineae bacterium]|nr:ATP-binding protein [Anaerolineae bacterium]